MFLPTNVPIIENIQRPACAVHAVDRPAGARKPVLPRERGDRGGEGRVKLGAPPLRQIYPKEEKRKSVPAQRGFGVGGDLSD